MKTITINIKKCTECPHFSHTGAFTHGGAKPCCDHPSTVKLKGDDCFKRVIPHRNVFRDNSEPWETPIKVPKRIPNWCPL